jgi:carboxymethylenebutenolidase
MTVAPTIESHKILLQVGDGTSMPAYLAKPPGSKPSPAIIVLQEIFGVNAHMRDVTERFARAGYTALTPALFHRTAANFEIGYTDMSIAAPHVSALTDKDLTADVTAAHKWLTASSGGAASKVGAVGYCMGGRVSFLANAVLPLQCAVSYYGGGIAPGPRANAPSLLDRAKDLHAPMLCFWGGKDAHITKSHTRAVADAIDNAGKPHTEVTFSYADHGFFCDARASYNPAAAKQAWAMTLAFFETHLRS